MTMKLHSSASPSRKECEAAWQNGQASVVFSVEAADLLTPVSAYMRLTHLHTGAGRHSLLLGKCRRRRFPWPLFRYRPDAGSDLDLP